MLIDVTPQVTGVPTFPLGPLSHFAGSALPVEIEGIPDSLADGDVSGVSVALVNADGIPFEANCTRAGRRWVTVFRASCFPTTGIVQSGFKVSATLSLADGSEFSADIAVGDFELAAASPNATPGDPSRSFVTKGSDVYLKSYLTVDDVQHYVRQTMAFDERVGWGAVWSGDYILANGEFIPYTPQEQTT